MTSYSSAPIDPLEQVTSFGYSRSFPSQSPIAQASVERDLDEYSDDEAAVSSSGEDDELGEALQPSTSVQSSSYSMMGSYRRPSFTMAVPRATMMSRSFSDRDRLSRIERERALEEERSLLRDNNVIPPRHPQQDGRRKRGFFSSLLAVPGGDKNVVGSGQPPAQQGDRDLVNEHTALLGDPQLPYGGQDTPENISQRWEEAVKEGKIHTTWQRELKVLGSYAGPLMITFVLQYSLTVASIFTVGHLGKAELGAVSLASMTANITGYAVYQGLATSLDTLCAQAYGSGRKKLVGLQMQRMIYFLCALTIPIGIVWLLAEQILLRIVPEAAVAKLAGLYLKVVLIGAPGYACFESGKRFVQAQGIFSASLYVLLFCAPFNAFLNWFLVWKLDLGFVGAPIAVAITDNLLPFCLFLYVRFVNGRQCWNGFTKRAFHNWRPMIRLALPGLVMVEAEVLAFEILTFAAAYFGITALAAQSVLATLTSLTFQIPFPLSIAGSTRIANLIGATLAPAARTAAKVTGIAAVFVGIFNVVILSALRNHIPRLFTNEEDVVAIVSGILPLCAAFQLFDALAACCNGILRGLGRQEIGGYVQLFCYYIIAMPISMGTAFGLNWGLWGLWTGVAIALGLVAIIEGIFLRKTDWQRSVEEANMRNLMG